MTQLGRISGPLLEENLVRNGVDLTFRNFNVSEDLLYLNVSNNILGINKTPVTNRVEVDDTTHTTDLVVDTQTKVSNIVLSSNQFTTYVAHDLYIEPNASGSNPIALFDHLVGGDLDFKDNAIRSVPVNGNIGFDPNGTGIMLIDSSATVNGNLNVTGNVRIDGNLSEASNIIVGDTPLDTVTVVPDFTQSIIPGDNLTYDLGSLTKRWRQVFVHQNADIGTLHYNDITISSQMQIDSSVPSIFTLQSNENLSLNPDTGITYIERFKFEDDTITNIDETAATLASTGIGYTRFVDVSGLVIPSGDNSQRTDFPTTPEVGTTRWNTDNPANNYLECFDGTTWNISTGPGGSISTVENYDLANAYILMLG